MIIVDGDAIVPKETHQIVLHVVAALPGDKVFGHLPHDCDEGLLLALTGFFTDMALSWFLDRPVIYTPLKICSIYAGIIGSVATAAGNFEWSESTFFQESKMVNFNCSTD